MEELFYRLLHQKKPKSKGKVFSPAAFLGFSILNVAITLGKQYVPNGTILYPNSQVNLFLLNIFDRIFKIFLLSLIKSYRKIFATISTFYMNY